MMKEKMMLPALSIEHAHKTYANGFTALKDISFDVAQGEFFALLGPNGAGKTTLISAIAGLSQLTSGHIRVMGFDTKMQSNSARMNLGLVPQELVFDPFFNVREVLRIQSGYFGLRRNDDWIDEMLHHLGLSDKAQTNLRHLSGGMKRRVMVAQAMVHRPPLIILDEPTAGVDVELRHSLWQFIQSMNQKGHTIILTTHYLEEAQQYCQRIAMLKKGELVTLDKTENLLHNGQIIRVQIRTQCRLPAHILAQVAQEIEPHTYLFHLADYNQLTALAGSLHQAQIPVEQMQILENDLEQIFLDLTKTV